MGKALVVLLISINCSLYSQKEHSKWYFGEKAGLDFITSPPAILTGTMNSLISAASIADANGNLLFYTDGITVYNKLHQVMANGQGLLGNMYTTQGALIIKKPASTSLYYLFTLDHYHGPNGLQYSIVDMNLAAGNGSVISKNNLLYTPSTDKLSGARHCNGEDFWVVSHEWNSNNFRSYLLSSSGISGTPVISQVGAVHTGTAYNSAGQMKISPDSKKLAYAKFKEAELFDFDNSSGKVSNNLNLLTITNPSNSEGVISCEFSPDSKKLYVGGGIRLIQFDLAAGTNTAIVASQVTLSTNTNANMQLAIDGKIYMVCNGNNMALSVINQPNLLGSAYGFTLHGQSVASNTVGAPPNMINLNYGLPPTFSFAGNCQSVTFSVSSNLQLNHPCASYVGETKWDFGDGSGAGSNTTTILNPSHFYTVPGTYTAMLVVTYPGRTDTVRQQIVVTGISPSFSVSGKTSICVGEQAVLSASGAYSYSWSSGAITSTALVKPTQSQSFTVTAKDGSCTTSQVHSVTVNPCLSISDHNEESGSIYPNPFGETLRISAKENCTLVLTDISGKIVLSKQIPQGESKIETQSIVPGVYLAKITGSTTNWQSKLVKVERE